MKISVAPNQTFQDALNDKGIDCEVIAIRFPHEDLVYADVQDGVGKGNTYKIFFTDKMRDREVQHRAGEEVEAIEFHTNAAGPYPTRFTDEFDYEAIGLSRLY